MVKIFYESDPLKRERLIAGWQRFQEDLADYELGPLVENVSETGQDFANLKPLINQVKEVRELIKLDHKIITGDFERYSNYMNLSADLDKELSGILLFSQKQLKANKDKQIDLIIKKADYDLVLFANDNNYVFKEDHKKPDWKGAIKGLKTMDSVQRNIDILLEDLKLLVLSDNKKKPKKKEKDKTLVDWLDDHEISDYASGLLMDIIDRDYTKKKPNPPLKGFSHAK